MKFLIIIITLLITLNSCGIYQPSDARKVPPDAKDRVKKNLEEGKGLRLGNLMKGRGTNFQFASSNPIWRASLDVLEFAPLLNANYSGGIIITDWISTEDQNTNEFYKITIKFLSNEIRSDALKIILHEKNCNSNNQCKISEIESNAVKNEVSKKILKISSIYEKQDIKKIKE
jgi:predicted small lipoprotein YifL